MKVGLPLGKILATPLALSGTALAPAAGRTRWLTRDSTRWLTRDSNRWLIHRASISLNKSAAETCYSLRTLRFDSTHWSH